MTNICYCGAQAGYPHANTCPYPLFRATKKQETAWYKAQEGDMNHMSQLSHALTAAYRLGWVMIEEPPEMPERAIAYLSRGKDRAWLIQDSTESGLQFTIRLIEGGAI